MRTAAVISSVALFLAAHVAFAHVVVRPDTAGIGSFQTFTVSVPSEKDFATVELHLLLPDGLEFVTPSVKPGWNVEVLKHAFPSGEHPYEIQWGGGSVPGHFRDDFTFSAKVPTTPAVLQWKAYQKYSDGSVVSWDLGPDLRQPTKPDGSPDFSSKGPYSKTNIVDDLGVSKTNKDASFSISIAALLVALASAAVSLRKKAS